MPPVGFEPTIPVFERAKTVYAIDRAATVIDKKKRRTYINGNRNNLIEHYAVYW
jgi:hypothetical protein